MTSGSFKEHLDKVEEVMKSIQLAGLKCKIDKCKFAVPKVEYLGYIITREGIKPIQKKIEAIINLERPKDKKGEAVLRHGTILPWLIAKAQWDNGTAYGID